MIRRLTTAGALLAAVFMSQSATAMPASSTILVAKVPVSYGDLDVSTPAGVSALKARLAMAASQACGGHPTFHTQYRAAPTFVRADFERCRASAEQGAVAALQQRGIVVAEYR